MQKALNHVFHRFCDLTKVSVSVMLLCQSDHSLCEQPDTQHFPILGGQSHGPDVTHSLLDGTWLGSPTTEVRGCLFTREQLCYIKTHPEDEVVLHFGLDGWVVHMERCQLL